MRKTMSLPAPAGNPLTIVIGLTGHCCALAGAAANARNTASWAAATRRQKDLNIELGPLSSAASFATRLQA
jgi:hypothetical protein